MSGDWKSQKFDAEGSPTASGILRQLGRPSLDEFIILVREAAQNSWDARREDMDVDFVIRVERLGERSATWRNVLLPGPAASSISRFESALAPDAWFLVVSDRGTQGLGGPVRATERPADGEKNDFVQFLRNVGEPRDINLGGGTYGFGKGIFYRTSTVRTIIADSRILRNGRYERRLMGAALGNDYYDTSDVRFTGRHWWGRISEGVVDPLVGADAEDTGETLGLPGFGETETGTNIVVLGADLGLVGEETEPAADPEALGAHLASAMLWNLWPKFRSISERATPAMTFAVIVDGIPLAIPSPIDVPALRPFIESFNSLESEDRRIYRRSSPPKIHGGDLVVKEGIAPMSETAVVQSARPFDGAPHHVARMRQAGLVVDYFEGPAHPDNLFCYGGVFRSSEGADAYFAAAEPPTHDGWNPEGLTRDARLVVQGAQRFVRDDLMKRFAAVPSAPSGHDSSGLGHGSRRLSGLVAGVQGTGADPVGAAGGFGPGVSNGRTGSGSAGARLVGDPWTAPDGETLGVFTRVRIEDPESLATVRAHLDVVLDGGAREGDPPRGAFTPMILRWVAADDDAVNQEGDVLSDTRGIRDWIVVAQFSDAAVTRFRLDVEASSDGS